MQKTGLERLANRRYPGKLGRASDGMGRRRKKEKDEEEEEDSSGASPLRRNGVVRVGQLRDKGQEG